MVVESLALEQEPHGRHRHTECVLEQDTLSDCLHA